MPTSSASPIAWRPAAAPTLDLYGAGWHDQVGGMRVRVVADQLVMLSSLQRYGSRRRFEASRRTFLDAAAFTHRDRCTAGQSGSGRV